jgi:hypothetical protein
LLGALGLLFSQYFFFVCYLTSVNLGNVFHYCKVPPHYFSLHSKELCPTLPLFY